MVKEIVPVFTKSKAFSFFIKFCFACNAMRLSLPHKRVEKAALHFFKEFLYACNAMQLSLPHKWEEKAAMHFLKSFCLHARLSLPLCGVEKVVFFFCYLIPKTSINSSGFTSLLTISVS